MGSKSTLVPLGWGKNELEALSQKCILKLALFREVKMILRKLSILQL